MHFTYEKKTEPRGISSLSEQLLLLELIILLLMPFTYRICTKPKCFSSLSALHPWNSQEWSVAVFPLAHMGGLTLSLMHTDRQKA
jgi:hypothetical protein